MNRSSFLKTLAALCVAPIAAAKVVSDSVITSRLAAVDQQFAASSKELAAALSRVNVSAQYTGRSFDELLKVVKSVQQTALKGDPVLGSSLKETLQRTTTT